MLSDISFCILCVCVRVHVRVCAVWGDIALASYFPTLFSIQIAKCTHIVFSFSGISVELNLFTTCRNFLYIMTTAKFCYFIQDKNIDNKTTKRKATWGFPIFRTDKPSFFRGLNYFLHFLFLQRRGKDEEGSRVVIDLKCDWPEKRFVL